MAANPTWRSEIGVAKEATQGTAVVPAFSLPVNGFNPKRVPTILRDNAWRGSGMNHGTQHGKIHTEFEIPESPFFVDGFGYIALGIFGETAISGAGPYAHTFASLGSGDQQPPSLTVTDENTTEVASRAWPGCQLAEVKLTIDPDGNMMWSASGLGFPDAAAAAFTASYTQIQPFEGWRMSATLNGTAIQPVNLEVTFSRNVNPIKTANNSQNPSDIFAGPLEIAINGNIVAEGATHHTALAANTTGVFALTGTRFATTLTETILLTCTSTSYEAVGIDRGNDWMEFELDLITNDNTTDVGASLGRSPGKLTLTNAKSTAYSA